MPRKQTKKMGVGSIFRPEYQDRQGRKRESTVWWLQYYRNGRRVRESAETADRQKAMDLLRERLSDVHHGRESGPGIDRTTFDDMKQLIVDDYTLNGRDLRVLTVCRMPPLVRAFAGWPARDINEKAILRYMAARKREKKLIGGKHKKRSADTIASSTINRELTTLKRMFSLAFKARMVARIPNIEMLEENNARKGFVELADVAAAKQHVGDPSVRALIDVSFVTGWRMDAELLERQWSDIDFNAGEIRLAVGEGKDRNVGRVFPMTRTLRQILEDQRDYVRAIEQRENKTIPWVFVRPNGSKILYCKKAIRAAFKSAGMPEMLPHDFRRSAVRNLERAKVPRSIAKKMVGHKTDSVYERYAIVDQSMLDIGKERLEQFLESQPATREVA